jgi:hypothetical protein
MKVLFVLRHPAAIRSLGAVLRLLDERGHQVQLAFGGGGPKLEAHRVIQELADESQGLTLGAVPDRGSPGWTRDSIGWSLLTARLRRDTDFLRYLEPAYADASALRERAARRAGPDARRLLGVTRFGGARFVRAGLESAERCLEPPQHIVRYLEDLAPDVVVTTHLARDGVQVDFVRAANRLGIHTAYPVFSWDNLSNKGLVHEAPELVLVWNEIQADEAVKLQSLPRERVRVLGAWSYDHWFDWEPSRTRENFCRVVGLLADKPIVLYVCSSSFVAPQEVPFVRRWIGELRRRGGALSEAGVIVRPHPRNSREWHGVTLDDPQAVVWPPHGQEPFEVVSRRNYYDSIYHSAAVVGINTSAQIESAIVGRPVHTVLADDFRETQQGTIHFQYLKADEFGHLHVGRTMEEHLDQLEESVRGGGSDHGRNKKFLRTFVRPLGLDVEATPLYVETLEELAVRPRTTRERAPALAPLARLALRPLAKREVRKAEELRKRRAGRPTDDVKIALRRMRREYAGTQVFAGPWTGSELDELLRWVPFLRWVQTSSYGLRDRLTVVVRPGSEPWYADIGGRRVVGEAAPQPSEETYVLRPEILAGSTRPRFLFAPLAVDAQPPADLPAEFVAVQEPRAGATVPLAGLDRAQQAAVLARSRGYVGTWGPEAATALLIGVPAVVLDGVEERDLELVRQFLGEAPYGRLEVVSGGDVDEQVGRLLARPAFAEV